ncbi:type II toxin-antitoxin system RelE family toxin [Thermodesulfatator indicus]|uniref:type II toxin-antitoxin system RelE family toxin n=1 Tax=Thermodesulfatator indicus TaxID=171695 RepID=UPI0002FC45BD|nr:hypothetical protein [Thermodesulfatator indicus]
MSFYEVRFTPTAFESVKKLPPEIKKRIRKRIEWLAENLDLIKPIPLKGKFESL